MNSHIMNLVDHLKSLNQESTIALIDTISFQYNQLNAIKKILFLSLCSLGLYTPSPSLSNQDPSFLTILSRLDRFMTKSEFFYTQFHTLESTRNSNSTSTIPSYSTTNVFIDPEYAHMAQPLPKRPSLLHSNASSSFSLFNPFDSHSNWNLFNFNPFSHSSHSFLSKDGKSDKLDLNDLKKRIQLALSEFDSTEPPNSFIKDELSIRYALMDQLKLKFNLIGNFIIYSILV